MFPVLVIDYLVGAAGVVGRAAAMKVILLDCGPSPITLNADMYTSTLTPVVNPVSECSSRLRLVTSYVAVGVPV